MSADSIHWGFIGCGMIANDFALALRSLGNERHVLSAVATSGDEKRANEFAERFATGTHKPKAYGDYQQLVNDPNVQVVYVNTTHNFHFDHTMLALKAGKHVLCEKAFALNTEQTEQVVKLARSKNLFLMEAMWTRYFPAIHRLRELLNAKQIGDVVSVRVDFGQLKPKEDSLPRYNDPNLAGGSLLDLGVYAVSFASMVYGGTPPRELAAVGTINQFGVDDHVVMSIKYSDEQFASLESTFNAESPCEAVVIGNKGHIRVHGQFNSPDTISWQTKGHELKTEHFEIPNVLDRLNAERPSHVGAYKFNFGCHQAGMIWEAEEVAKCLRSKSLESHLMPLNETVEIMRTLDGVRKLLGLVYPGEPESSSMQQV